MKANFYLLGAVLILTAALAAACAQAGLSYPTQAPEASATPTETAAATLTMPAPSATPSVSAATATGAVGPVVSTPVTAIAVPGPGIVPTSGVTVEVQSGTFKKTVAPGGTTAMPLNNGSLYVLVHYPTLIPPEARANLHPQIVQPATGDWQVQVGNPPAGDILAFHVVGSTVPGSFTVEVNGTSGLPPVQFGVATTPDAEVTLADDRQTVTINNGESFALKLGELYNWTVTIDNQDILSRQVNILTVRGVQGVYGAHRPGQTVLHAFGDPACRQSHPPCALPSRAFQITVVVLATG